MRRLSLRLKLIAVFLVLACMVAGASLFQLRTINNLQSRFADLINNSFARLLALNQVKHYALEIENEVLTVTPSRTKDDNTEAQLRRIASQVQAVQVAYQAKVSTDSNRETVVPMREITDRTEALAQEALDLHQAEGRLPAVQVEARKTQLKNNQAALSQLVDSTIKEAEMQVNSENQQLAAAAAQSVRLTLLMATTVTAAFLVLGIVVTTRLTQRLAYLRAGAQRISNGDFSKRVAVTTRDELGDLAASFNQMAERLRDSYQRLAIEKQRDEAILQNMGEGLIAVDGQARVVLINQKATAMLDLEKPKEVLGKELRTLLTLYNQDKRLLPPEQIPPFVTLASGQVANDVLGYHKKEGQQVLLDIISTPIVLDEKVVGVITLLRDVTHEKEVDRMKTEFISLASHQLRTPLSAIKWYSEMLLSGDAGELQSDQQEFTRSIAESTERMIQLVNSLLNISRIESGRIVVDPKPTDLKELVSGIIDDLKAKTQEKQQSLAISVHADLPKINLDPRLIGQVYLNLLTNAIKYTPKGGEISVFISRKGDEVVSQVTDSGYGIPKEQQGRLFQKFFRASNAVKVETDGTGLGLYLIKAIVESSGGRIWFESEEGKGTTFWFSLPLAGMKPKEGEVTLDT